MIIRRAFLGGSRLTSVSSSPAAAVRRHLSTHPESDLSQGHHLPEHPQEPPTNDHKKRPIDWEAPMSLKDDFDLLQRFRSTSGMLGSTISPHYKPHRMVTSPPRPKDITLELLLASGAHLGHSTSLWNPANQRYIFGIRQGIHIISLEQTAAHLRRAAKVVEGVARNGGLVLFVGNRQGQDRAVVEAARMTGGCHLFGKWVPGTITNGTRIVGHGALVEKDFADRASPDGPLTGQDPLRPDLVVCLNPLENYILLHECGLYGIPTIGVIDTDANPTWVTYPIPANDDSLRCIQLIAGVLGRAGENGKNQRIRKTQHDEAMESRMAENMDMEMDGS
ncbi:ribosomal protein S2, flavodoxin-like domain-containing protein [Tricharina praecox]|uniref:ribosomal protein S2, flavodoxin-like domain-containing protein n=1 Tax=Tricharina praecox TaxID=43433 RepID=UPI00221FCE8E|nr:ribosomal protein S2, flavodoxin-like domain-containing protein [Tricharina praecox]KAI5855301.1 ribosomal protein S2, flavodoxin-like domain-containing protein [Tricharina praecox]